MRHVLLAVWFMILGGCGDKPTELATTEQDMGTDVDMHPENVDFVDYSCMDPAFVAGPCTAGTVMELPLRGASHIDLPTPIVYEDNPPASGDHRGQWARWGEYEFLPPQRWVHNLEHGGIAFLYNPCADPALVDQLREFAKSRPEDPGGPFRWVMTPYPGLPSAIAAVAWTWTYEAECVDPADMDMFVANQYRQAPEDIGSDGSFHELWLGK